ncbi:MAG: MBL fold metallo-hydrolase [Candidatus Lokiarchaeota archaeon]|nr:MBL fold metallo-hydrolase [Candidatus Lokiarchaeota archaeon]
MQVRQLIVCVTMTVNIQWLGHAGFMIENEVEKIFIDLYVSDEHKNSVNGPASIYLISHGHRDHCHPESFNLVKTEDTIVIGTKGCAKSFDHEIHMISPDEECNVRDVKIKSVHAYNTERFRSPGEPFHPKDYGCGFVIQIDGKTIYHAGDTGLISEMEQIGPVDVAMLPCGDTYTMDNVEAAEAAKIIKPRFVIPMHIRGIGISELRQMLDEIHDIELVEMEVGDTFSI